MPKSVERSTYVLFASLALILLFWQWRPMPAVVWQVADPQLAMAIIGAVVRRLAAGVHQHLPDQPLRAVRAASGRRTIWSAAPCRQPRFKTPVLYKVVRHPIYLGFIIAFWAAPTMTVGHLLFAAVTTAYIFVGIFLEERDLIELFGDDYRRYRERVAMLVPSSATVRPSRKPRSRRKWHHGSVTRWRVSPPTSASGAGALPAPHAFC